MSAETSPVVSCSLVASLGLYRALVATPFDALAIKQILTGERLRVIVQSHLYREECVRVILPNVMKYLAKTPLQLSTLAISSRLIPQGMDRSTRGLCIGSLAAAMETLGTNVFHVLRTRRLENQSWTQLRKDAPNLWRQGLGYALLHRVISWGVFMSIYEKATEAFPDHSFMASTGAGMLQVASTAPIFNAMIHAQSQRSGLICSLFLHGLVPRIAHSAITSGPVMWLIDTKLQLIHREKGR